MPDNMAYPGPTRLLSCLIVLALLAAARPSRADYTVEYPNDSYPAWALRDAFKHARNQDSTGTITILIKPGTHDDTKVDLWKNTNRRVIFKAKDPSQPRPILRGNQPTSSGSSQFAFQNLKSTDANGRSSSVNPRGTLVLEHLEIDGRKTTGVRGGSDAVATGFIFCGGVVVKDCVIHDYSQDGIHFGGDDETTWACTEGPTGFFEIHDTEIYRTGADTTHAIYIGHAGILIARGVTSHSGVGGSALKSITKNFEISGCTLSSTMEPDPETTLYKCDKLLDVGACARGVIYNNTLNKYKGSSSGVLRSIVDIRKRNSQYGANEPHYLDAQGVLFDRAYWDLVYQDGVDLQDATNKNLFHIFFWNNTVNVVGNPSAKTEVFTNWGTYTAAVWTDFSSWGFTLPQPEAWLERSVVWVGPNTYDTQHMGQMIWNDSQENLMRNPEWKSGDGYLPDLPNGHVHFVESANIPGWGQPFSTMPSEDEQGPSAPGNLQAAEAGGRRVVLTWTRSTDNVAVAGYRIYRNGQWLDMVAVPVFIDVNVAADTSYTYEVEAYDVVGQAGPRAALQVNTGTASGLVARDNFQSASGWSGSLALTGRAEIRTTYSPDAAPGSGGTPTPPRTPSSVLRLRGPSTATRTVDLSGVSDNVQLLVRWYKGKLEADDKAYIEVNDGNGWQTVLTIDRRSTEGWMLHQAHIDLSGFNKSSAFQIRLATSVDDDDDYVYFDNLEIIRTTTAAPTGPAAPTGLTAILPLASNAATLSWTDNANNEYGFLIERRLTSGTDSDFAVIKAVPAGTTVYTDAASGTIYTYHVRAYNQAGWSDYSNKTVPSPSLDTTAPAAIEDLMPGNPDSRSIDLTWTAPGDDGNEGTAAAYDIRYSTNEITAGNFSSATPVGGLPAPQAAGTSQGMTVRGLMPDTSYYFAIKTRDEVLNWSDLSNVVPARTTPLEAIPPAAVTNLRGSHGTGPGTIQLTWTATGDDDNTGTASSYEIRYSLAPLTSANFASGTLVSGTPTPLPAGTQQQMTVSGLTIGQRCYFAMLVKDEVPNTSALSNNGTAKAGGMGQTILQRGLNSYDGTRDGFVQASSPTSNFNSYEYMRTTGLATAGGAGKNRSFVKFDLTSIPVGTNIVSAHVYLYSYNAASILGTTGSYGLYRIARDWGPGQITWNVAWTGTSWTTPGIDFEAVPDAQAPRYSVVEPSWYEWDVTNRVQQWISNGGTDNYGWALILTDETLEAQDDFYQSSDPVPVDKRPMLAVTTNTLARGDINGDGNVNVADLLELVESWGAAVLQPAFNPDCDLNGDCRVNVGDLQLLINDWPQ